MPLPAFAKKFQIGGLSRDKLYPLAKSENSKVVYLEVSAKEKDMPKSVHVSLDGRSGARVREIDFDLTPVPVSTRTAKGLARVWEHELKRRNEPQLVRRLMRILGRSA